MLIKLNTKNSLDKAPTNLKDIQCCRFAIPGVKGWGGFWLFKNFVTLILIKTF